MNILAAIRREERKLEKQVCRLEKQLDGLRTAAKVLGNSASADLSKARKRVMTPAIRAKISASAKKRWAKIKAGAKKSVS